MSLQKTFRPLWVGKSEVIWGQRVDLVLLSPTNAFLDETATRFLAQVRTLDTYKAHCQEFSFLSFGAKAPFVVLRRSLTHVPPYSYTIGLRV